MKVQSLITGAPEAVVTVQSVLPNALDRVEALLKQAEQIGAASVREAVSGGAIGPGRGVLQHAVKSGIDRHGESVVAWVGVQQRAAWLFRFHDQGFHGTVRVRAHKRWGGVAFGRRYRGDFHWVLAHVRRIDYAGHHFMAEAAAKAQAVIATGLKQIGEVLP